MLAAGREGTGPGAGVCEHGGVMRGPLAGLHSGNAIRTSVVFLSRNVGWP